MQQILKLTYFIYWAWFDIHYLNVDEANDVKKTKSNTEKATVFRLYLEVLKLIA